jgi:hypothetical protein
MGGRRRHSGGENSHRAQAHQAGAGSLRGLAEGSGTVPAGGLHRVPGRRAQPIITILRPNTG